MKTSMQMAIKRNKNIIITVAVCVVVIFSIILFLPNNSKNAKPDIISDYSSVNAICELATLKSYYHNVVLYEKEPSGGEKFLNDILLWPFGVYTKIGYKQFWMEYSGIIETGIDASRIQINSPSKEGIVEVFVPDASVLSAYADINSLTEPLSEKGFLTTITGEEKAEAFAEAQNAMRNEAENDQALLRRSKENAKMLIERYIINTGKEMGIDFSVSWIETPH